MDASVSDSGSASDSGESTPSGQTVETQAGPIQGESIIDLVIFRGIPYAAAPVGALRFKPPAPVQAWQEVKDTTEFGPACPQPVTAFGNPGTTSEDCLSLNVWSHADKKRRPVMVWIHGGGYSIGSSNQALYEGSQLARLGDVLVVSLNYRLGALGFLATEDLIAESPDNTAGNYGLKDQVAALQWVKDNIERFGGDSHRVTVFGESAGAMSICALLAAPTAQGLFHRAILQSAGGCYGLTGLRNPSPFGDRSAIDLGAAIVSATSCKNETDKLTCLRTLTADEIVTADNTQQSLLFGLAETAPNKDGVFITSDAYDLYANGVGPNIEIIAGANADEMALFFASLPLNKLGFETYVRQTFPQQANALFQMYPVPTDAEAWGQYVALWSDIAFICPALAFTKIVANQGISSYAYHFTHKSVAPNLAPLGAFHSLELAYIFHNHAAFGILPTSDDLKVGNDLIQAWSSFAITGVPMTPTAWPVYSASAPAFANFEAEFSISKQLRNGRCAELRQLYLTR